MTIGSIGTVLIANRGEIALRIARTCREMGLRSVVVYSTADRDSAAVRFADHAVHIGPSESRRSYRNASAIIQAAVGVGADAVHPGYGFLSEDADFADICESHGLTFIGPPSAVLARLEDKAAARRLAVEAGLPVLPGSMTAVGSAVEARAVATEIGYPAILKAAAGGGGRGMAVVSNVDELAREFDATAAVAQATFGDGRLYLERFVAAARHIEVQVLADRYGAVVQLGERDCSVQRRHQKLVEEAPAPGLPASLREQLTTAAARAAAAMGYVGAGTFEFVVDQEGDAYFLEINSRIQVEHPVTEMVTGIDLVREQIHVAAGLPLALQQADVEPRGVAIECRVNAEDPARGFAPTPGVITDFVTADGPFTRVDTHVFPGWTIAPHYDSLLAKVIVWAPDRPSAIARMDRSLDEFHVTGTGVRTTIGFLRDVLADGLYRAARHTTSLVDQMQRRSMQCSDLASGKSA